MPDTNAKFVESLRRFGGMFGSAFKDGVQMLDLVEVSGATDVNRIEMPMVGRTRLGYKRGRESNEGTLRVQKFDSTWEVFVHQFVSQTLEDRYENPGQSIPTFDLKIQYHDPDTYGKEVWQLEGCQIWRLPLGFDVTEDIVQREYPLTWEEATPIETFVVDRVTGAVQQVHTAGQ